MERLQDTVCFRSRGVRAHDQEIGHGLSEDLAIGNGEAHVWDPITHDMTTVKKGEGGRLIIHSQRDGQDYLINGRNAAQDHAWGRTRQVSNSRQPVEDPDWSAEARDPRSSDDD